MERFARLQGMPRTWKEGCHFYLYFCGSCLRMSRTVEIAYSPVSSVRTSSSPAPLPVPDTATKTCTHAQPRSQQAHAQPTSMQGCAGACSWQPAVSNSWRTLRMLRRKARSEVTLMQLMNASVMYCAAHSQLQPVSCPLTT